MQRFPRISALVVLLVLLALAMAQAPATAPLGPGAHVASRPSSSFVSSVPVSVSSNSGAPSYTPVFPSPIRHVFVVVLENEEATSVIGTAPYETHLAYQYAYASKYYATTHPSAPNYLSMTSGSYFNQSGSDAYNVWKSINIADLVQNAGETWAGYDESMPAPCDINNSYPYEVKHNPLTYYADIIDAHASRCNPNDLSFNAWNSSVSSGNLPNYAIITPNMLDDGHDTGLAYVDNWLSKWLPPLINNSAVFSTSAFFLVYDEGSTNAGYNGTAGGNVYMSVVSPYSHMGYWSQKDYSHWNMLTTAEWLLGLTGHTYHNDNWTKWPPMKDLFTFPAPSPGPSHYIVQGTVWGTGGAPLTGAVVSTNLGNTSTTAANGTYRFALTNGTYTLTGSATGYASSSTTFTISGAGRTVDLNLSAASPKTYTLSGNIETSYPTTTALAGVDVFANATGGVSTSATSSGSGTFQLQLPNGTYTLVGTAPYYTPSSRVVTVAGGAASVTIVLAPRSLSVSVTASVNPVTVGSLDRVTVSASDPNGQPATGAVLSITSSPLALPFSPAASVTIPSNGSGFVSFVAPSVTASTTVSVTAFVASGSAFPGQGLGSLSVVPAGSSLPATITGEVLNASSATPLAGATVKVIDQSTGAVSQTQTTGVAGTFTASGLSAGTYELFATAPGFYGATRNVTAPAGATLGPFDLNLTPSANGGGSALSVSVQANPTSGTAPLLVNFLSNVTGGTGPYVLAWSFGDGGQSAVADPSHTYGQGTFTATLTVTDHASHTRTASVTVTVSAALGGSGPGTSGGILGALGSDPLLLVGILVAVAVIVVVAVVATRRRKRALSPPEAEGPSGAYVGTAGAPAYGSYVEVAGPGPAPPPTPPPAESGNGMGSGSRNSGGRSSWARYPPQ